MLNQRIFGVTKILYVWATGMDIFTREHVGSILASLHECGGQE